MLRPTVVSIVTKIRILKQITTKCALQRDMECCIYSNKDKNFKANHNVGYKRKELGEVVSIVTKIRILKQITTTAAFTRIRESCIYSNKDKNFKANHNNCSQSIPVGDVVSIVTKIRILKQITTIAHGVVASLRLYL